jgi:hypothetical protein
MDNQETETKELTPETPKPRKRKLLTDPERIRASCKVCLEVGNLDNLIRHAVAVKDKLGVEMYGAFSYVYFCSENCLGLFKQK